MRPHFIAALAIVALSLMCSAMAADEADLRAGKVVYRSSVSAGQDIVIHMTETYDVRGLGEMSLDQDGKLAVYQLEWRKVGQSPVVLGTWLSLVGTAEYDRAFGVLDLMMEPGKVSILTTEGSSVRVRQFRVGYPDMMVILSGWEMRANLVARDQTNTIGKLRLNATGELEADVLDRESGATSVRFVIPRPVDPVIRKARAKAGSPKDNANDDIPNDR